MKGKVYRVVLQHVMVQVIDREGAGAAQIISRFFTHTEYIDIQEYNFKCIYIEKCKENEMYNRNSLCT